MPDLKISQLPAVTTPLAGTEVLPIVQAGTTKKVTVTELAASTGLIYLGTWNASTNTPTITSSVGSKGQYYIVSIAGSTNIDGITDWQVGDWVIFSGAVWQKIDNSDVVSSVNGQTGAVVLTTTDIAEGTNLYYTDARARTSVSAGTGISYDNLTGVVTNAAPDQTVSLTGAGTTSISGAYPNFTITSNDSTLGTVTSVDLTASTGISVSGGPITSSGSITVTNTAPDQVVSIGAGTGISVSGTYPNFTVTNTAPDVPFTYTSTYVTYGQGTTTPDQSADFTYDDSVKTLTAPQVNASNGILVNSATVSANYSIPSGSNAMSAGPVVVNSGIAVTVPSGSVWSII